MGSWIVGSSTKDCRMMLQEAFGVGGLPVTYSAVVTQMSSMLGFFVVLLLDRAIETCRGGPKAAHDGDVHELTTVKGYIVTVSSSDDTGTSVREFVVFLRFFFDMIY